MDCGQLPQSKKLHPWTGSQERPEEENASHFPLQACNLTVVRLHTHGSQDSLRLELRTWYTLVEGPQYTYKYQRSYSVGSLSVELWEAEVGIILKKDDNLSASQSTSQKFYWCIAAIVVSMLVEPLGECRTLSAVTAELKMYTRHTRPHTHNTLRWGLNTTI